MLSRKDIGLLSTAEMAPYVIIDIMREGARVLPIVAEARLVTRILDTERPRDALQAIAEAIELINRTACEPGLELIARGDETLYLTEKEGES